LRGNDHGPAATPFPPKIGRNRPNPAAHRHLGSVCRKSFADRFGMAYLGSGSILPRHGNKLDHPVETLDQMDAERAVVRVGPLSN
jgi:hypothetical protein